MGMASVPVDYDKMSLNIQPKPDSRLMLQFAET